jgi:DNA gyrase/topoisomerase IV subunit B
MSAASTEESLDPTGIALRALLLYALAEFQSGNATTIRVTAEGTSFSVSDNGRGHALDRAIDGSSYLKFIYTHFDYPFEPGQGAPVQLHGIGMSVVNALCSELALVVRKRDETLQLMFRDGKLLNSNRMRVASDETGISVSATVHPQLQRGGVAAEPLEAWLLGVLAASPMLRLYFNGRLLQVHAR